ncbi:MAG TPA: preprotein translocase subunit SecA [Pseudobdellovibrionaceae bacterium]|nr:preprotein translocase subunit SecA [Pseudobdellovibrionaceae bacterium]
MIQKILTKVFGTKHDREMKKIQPLVDQIASFEPKIKSLTDDQLKAKTVEFKERIARGETLDSLLPESFAVCREASLRVMGMRHYDVQMIGGIVLHRGQIAEMRTGEGKTLVATLPVYLNALSGKGVHVVTVNDYLAKRDAEWMGRLYNWLGLTTGIIVHGLNDRERKENYGADITYGTNNEFGFDYLRDNMKFDLEDYVQREHNFAIVDECDSILIDEARTPLIISGPAESNTDKYMIVNRIIPHLRRDIHFTMEEKSKTASLTEEGNSKVEELLKVDNIYDAQNIELLHHIYQALKAHHLYKLDVDYMIKDGEIVIVDEFTGRLMPGRRWSDGLHQAIEAKENVDVKSENQTLASITFQNYFRMYSKLAGMTGTADTEAVEFKKIYDLDVNVIPTNRSISRMDKDDVVYKNETAKFRAITADIKERHAKGQPILVGTTSIEKSESLSHWLKKEGIRHDVLNAKQHEREAEIVAQAGRKGSITIATNMAGRGTDIVLGGNPEVMTRRTLGEEALESPDYAITLSRFKSQCENEKREVIEAGGLYIIGTERHESRRIDNQLRGRSGRQGDPGESCFYLSLDDNLMRIFNGERIQKIMAMLKVDENEPITAKMVSNAIEGAQRKVEGHNFDIRKNLMEYDSVMNLQRNSIYGMRRKLLDGKEIERTVLDMLGDVVSHFLDLYLPEGEKKNNWSLEGLNNSLYQTFGFKVESREDSTSEGIVQEVHSKVKTIYDRQKASMGPYFEQVQKMVVLQSIDHHWKMHLQVIDKLKEGIGLRGYAQKDPLIEYKKEAFAAFERLNDGIKLDAVEKVMRVQLVAQQSEQEVLESFRPEQTDLESLDYSAPSDSNLGSTSPLGMDSHSSTNSAPKNRVSAQPRPSSATAMNRADRRRMEKGKGRK